MPITHQCNKDQTEPKRIRKSVRQSGPGSRRTGEKSYTDFLRYIGKYKWSLIFASIFLVTSSIFNLINQSKLSDVTDLITMGLTFSVDFAAVVNTAVLQAILYDGGFFLIIFRTKLWQLYYSGPHKICAMELVKKATVCSCGILSRVTNELDTVGRTMD